MEKKYSNRREVVRKGGKFAKQPTLQSQGYDINTEGVKTCFKCGCKSIPILNTYTCASCGATKQRQS